METADGRPVIENGGHMTTFLLKIIALLSMLIDHIGAVFPIQSAMIFRWVGRISFPLFAYMIAQGCIYTKNIYKYMLRLAVFAVVSEIPFDAAFGNGISFLRDTNIFYTLFFAVSAIAAYNFLIVRIELSKKCQKPRNSSPRLYDKQEGLLSKKTFIVAAISVIPSLILAELLSTDYGAVGVLLIYMLYLVPKGATPIVLAAGMFILYGANIFDYTDVSGWVFSRNAAGLFFFSLISIPLVLFHNGKQGPKLKWLFYVSYPLHLLILAQVLYLGFRI